MHVPVLLKEVIENLEFNKDDKVFVDATLGGAGHSGEVCKKYPGIKIIGIDQDRGAIEVATRNLENSGCQFETVKGNFRDFAEILDNLGIDTVDKVLFDLGMSSFQIDEFARGFSFQKDEPLLMTMKSEPTGEDLTACEIVNSWPKEKIAQVLKEYGEERFAWRIAEKIIQERRKSEIKTTFDLVRIIKIATPSFYHFKRLHPATRTFQALRIAVNDEIESLKQGLEQSFEKLKPDGRIAVISFHSLEDRIVKNFFRDLKTQGKGILPFRKPITPQEEEISSNPRSRSAKLRVIQKI